MKKLKLIKDCLNNKDYGKGKAQARATHDHKAGRRNYNGGSWKALCFVESEKAKP